MILTACVADMAEPEVFDELFMDPFNSGTVIPDRRDAILTQEGLL